MPQEVLCPICGAAYNLADEQIGKKVRCKKCEHAFTAGGEPKHRDKDDEEEDDRPRGKSKSRARRGRDRDEEEEERKPKKTKSLEEQAKPRGQSEPGLPMSSFVIMGVVVAVLVLCCGGGGLFWWALSSNARPPAAPRPQPPPPNRGGRRAEAPALRPAVAWLRDAEATRRAAGAAVLIADLMTPV